MSHTYLQAITMGFPLVQCHALGDGSVYETITWDGGEPLPSKETLDSWILSNPEFTPDRIISKYQFRKLFTFTERITIDNYQTNTNITAQNKAILFTILKDLELSGEVQLDNTDVIGGVNFLETVGLIAAGRASRILSNLPPV